MQDSNSNLRYHRQTILSNFGEAGQQKLGTARVLVVGAGGLGCPALQYLAAAGIGHITIVDDDLVDITNLHRQPLYSMADIGLPKAIQAARALQNLNPEIEVQPYVERLSVNTAITLIGEHDIVVDATDNFPSCYLINDACVLLGKPFVFGAVSRFEGQLALFNDMDDQGSATANYRDLFPNPPGKDLILDCEAGGVMGVVPGIIGNLQANETIKWVTGMGKKLSNRLLSFDALNNNWLDLEIIPQEETRLLIPNNIDEFLQTNYEWLCLAADSKYEIDVAGVDKLISMEGVEIIDIREPYEQPLIHAFSVQRIPMGELYDKKELIKSGTIVVVCQSGIRSLSAARQLSSWLGPSRTIYSLRGGVLGWIKQHSKTSS